jgi:hypothetical protein
MTGDLQKPKLNSDEKHNVALLMGSWDRAHDLTRMFKKLEVYPNFSDQFDEIWEQLHHEKIELLIVDVKKISDGSLHLLDHPCFKGRGPKIVLYYEDKDAPLLVSASQIPNIGILRGEIPLASQLKVILDRFNQFSEMEAELDSIKKQENHDEQKLDILWKENTKVKESNYYYRLQESFSLQMAHFSNESHYTLGFGKFFQHLKEIEAFSLYEFAAGRKKLVSPPNDFSKMVSLPPIWLGEMSQGDLNKAIEGTMTRAVVDKLGTEIIYIPLKGSEGSLEAFLYLKTNEEMMKSFPWDSFEIALQGFYLQYQSRIQLGSQKGTIITPYELLSLVDTEVHGVLPEAGLNFEKGGYHYIKGDFSNLFDLSLSSQGRKPWKTMMDQFMAQVGLRTQSTFKICYLNFDQLIFVVEKDDSEHFYKGLRYESGRFPFWKYFDSESFIFSDSLKPEYQYIPADRNEFLKLVGLTPQAKALKSPRQEILLGPVL